MTSGPAPDLVLLRHTLATVAYRAAKVLRDVPAGFADVRASETLRTPGQILAHMSDLFDWALSIASGPPRWHETPPSDWATDVDRFFQALRRFDEFLASGAPVLQFASVVLSMLTLRLTRSPALPKSWCERITPESSTAMPTPRPSTPV